MPPPAQVLSDLFDALAMLMGAKVDATARDQHNTEIAKVKDQIAQAKADLATENARMATEQAELEAQAYPIRLDQNASEEVMRRRYRSRPRRFMSHKISSTHQEQELVANPY